MKNFILGLLAAAVIGGVAFGAYYFGKQQSIKTVSPTPSQTLSPTETIVVSTTPMVTVAPENDTELIKQALIKKNNWGNMELDLTINKNDGTYATGNVKEKGDEAGGGYFFAKKVNGEWKIVADGNGVITCESLAPYPDYPATLISECYDEKTGTSIKR